MDRFSWALMSSNRVNTSCAVLHYTAKGCRSAVTCSTGKLLFSLQHLLASNWGLPTFLLNPTCLYTIQPRAVGASVTCSTLGLQTNRFEGFLCVMYLLYHSFHSFGNCFQLFLENFWTISTSRRQDLNLQSQDWKSRMLPVHYICIFSVILKKWFQQELNLHLPILARCSPSYSSANASITFIESTVFIDVSTCLLFR